MKDRSYIFLMMFFIAVGCGSQRIGDEVSNETWLASEHPNSPAKNNHGVAAGNRTQSESEEDVDKPKEEPEEEYVNTGEEQQEEAVTTEEPEVAPEEEPTPEEPEEEPTPEEPEDEEEVNSCFSYLDCPNHEACNPISSTCFLCTEGWHCNNHFDQQQTGPSFCCTAEDVDNQRCDMVGTCKE